MGQQQLLLLVLSTVIVGLATVAGIQAFDEGQTQATQDALAQRGLAIGTDITAALNQPAQLGGITSSADAVQVAAAAGLDDKAGSGKGIEATGAGNNADCDITNVNGTPPTITLICAENGKGNTNDTQSNDSSMGQTTTISIDENGASITTINGTDIGTL